jgi:hypothetical protein
MSATLSPFSAAGARRAVKLPAASDAPAAPRRKTRRDAPAGVRLAAVQEKRQSSDVIVFSISRPQRELEEKRIHFNASSMADYAD